MIKTKNSHKDQIKPQPKKTVNKSNFQKNNSIKKILVPLDGSKHCFRALDMAISLSSHYSSSITGIHIFDLPITLEFSIIDPVGERLKKKILGVMKTAKLRCESQKVPFESIMKHGKVGPAIIDLAKKEKFDVIIIGKRGISSVSEIFLGSVSHSVVHHTECSIIVVR